MAVIASREITAGIVREGGRANGGDFVGRAMRATDGDLLSLRSVWINRAEAPRNVT
jgi:hypothetical protein